MIPKHALFVYTPSYCFATIHNPARSPEHTAREPDLPCNTKQIIMEQLQEVVDCRAAPKDADAQPLKSSLRVNRVIMSSARFG